MTFQKRTRRAVKRRTNKNELITVRQDMRQQFPIDSSNLVLLETLEPPRISASLYCEIKESLRGFDENIQIEIVDDLYDYYSRIAKYYTGLPAVDRILSYFYRKIDKERIHVRKD